MQEPRIALALMQYTVGKLIVKVGHAEQLTEQALAVDVAEAL